MNYTQEDPRTFTSFNRRYCSWKDNGITVSTSYPRWLWQKENGIIPKGYIIHHRDGNSMNDDISNLIALSSKEHKKAHKELKIPFIEWIEFLNQHSYIDSYKKSEIVHIVSLLKAVEVMRILQLSRSTVYRMIERGELEVVRLGRSIRIKESSLEKYFNEKD